jgi:hypothetical protein
MDPIRYTRTLLGLTSNNNLLHFSGNNTFPHAGEVRYLDLKDVPILTVLLVFPVKYFRCPYKISSGSSGVVSRTGIIRPFLQYSAFTTSSAIFVPESAPLNGLVFHSSTLQHHHASRMHLINYQQLRTSTRSVHSDPSIFFTSASFHSLTRAQHRASL